MSTPILTGQNGLQLWPGIARLARWRFKQVWRFLLIIWLGMLAMVMLVCAGPLLARVAASASLRSQIASSPDGAYITVEVQSTHPTQSQLQQIGQQVDPALHLGAFRPYLQAAPVSIVQTPSFDMLMGNQTRAAAFHVSSYDSALMAQHATVVQGRLPQMTGDGTVEIALMQQVATGLNVHVGSTFQGRYPVSVGSQVWNFRVVGIIAPKTAGDAFWAMSNPFSTTTISLGSRYYLEVAGSHAFDVLAANEEIKPKIAVLQANLSTDFSDAFVLFWRYPFDLSHFDANDLPTLSQRASYLDTNIDTILHRNIQDVGYTNIFGTLFTALNFGPLDSVVLQITMAFLVLVILALVLFLVSLMSDVLVERQAATIATLRSRGALRQHIFGAIVVQGALVGLVALLAGPLLAVLLVSVMSRILLAPAYQGATNVITSSPLQAALGVKLYAIVAVAISLLVLILAVNRATKMDVVSFRRESARTRRIGLWRRFYLDLVLSVLLLVGYIVYSYVWSFLALSSSRIDPIIYTELTSVGFFAAPLLVVGVLLLFLRLFPLILHLATRLVARMRSAIPVLALAQMERTPRAAARIIVLLALAIASSGFLLTLVASKEQRNVAVATFSAGGADFSGPLPLSVTSETLSQLSTYYSGLPGVQAATLGYHDSIALSPGASASTDQGAITISAVDTTTYAHTAIWPTTYSSQPLTSLMAQLAAHRSDASTRGVVYALVDATTWQRLHLKQGDHFSLPVDTTRSASVNFVALAQIKYVPGVYDAPAFLWSGMGLLVDYQSYAVAKAKATGAVALSPNYIWLRTASDAATLKRIRNLLPGLNDRNQLLAAIQNDPNHFGILGILYIAIGAALFLALIGTLLLSWLNASNRLTSFVVARALGMAPRQIAAILLWEQGFVYILGLLLGVVMSALLMNFIGSAVAMTDTSGDWANIPNVPSIQLTIPYVQLLLVLAVMTIICFGGLLLMARIVSRPSLSQTLRLNED